MDTSVHFLLLLLGLAAILFLCRNKIEGFGNQLVLPQFEFAILTPDNDISSGYFQEKVCKNNNEWTNAGKTCRDYSLYGADCFDVGDNGKTAFESCLIACDNCPSSTRIKRRPINDREPSAVEDVDEPEYAAFESPEGGASDAIGGVDIREVFSRLSDLGDKVDILSSAVVGQKCSSLPVYRIHETLYGEGADNDDIEHSFLYFYIDNILTHDERPVTCMANTLFRNSWEFLVQYIYGEATGLGNADPALALAGWPGRRGGGVAGNAIYNARADDLCFTQSSDSCGEQYTINPGDPITGTARTLTGELSGQSIAWPMSTSADVDQTFLYLFTELNASQGGAPQGGAPQGGVPQEGVSLCESRFDASSSVGSGSHHELETQKIVRLNLGIINETDLRAAATTILELPSIAARIAADSGASATVAGQIIAPILTAINAMNTATGNTDDNTDAYAGPVLIDIECTAGPCVVTFTKCA